MLLLYTDIKSCTFLCLYDIIKINDIDLDNILIDEESYENFVIYDSPYGAKSLRIIFGKLGGYIRKSDGTKYLVLFHSNGKNERYMDKINYRIMLKSNISYVVCHKYAKIKIDSGDDLPLEKKQ